jgi:hypothetical protein
MVEPDPYRADWYLGNTMIELAICLALGLGLMRGIRLGHAWSVVSGSLIGYGLVADFLNVAAAAGEPLPALYAFVYIFLGPGGGPARTPGPLPLPLLLVNNPLWLRAGSALLAWVVVGSCKRESARLHPQLPRAYALDALAMPFLLLGILQAIVAVMLLFVRWLSG